MPGQALVRLGMAMSTPAPAPFGIIWAGLHGQSYTVQPPSRPGSRGAGGGRRECCVGRGGWVGQRRGFDQRAGGKGGGGGRGDGGGLGGGGAAVVGRGRRRRGDGPRDDRLRPSRCRGGAVDTRLLGDARS